MPATTPHGYPYPLGTDRVMDGDDSIHALADKVDTNLAAGMWSTSVPITVTTLNTPVPVAVTFPAGRFTTPPFVAVTMNTGAPNTNMCSASAVTTSGCQAWAVRTAGGIPVTPVVYVLAHGM